MKPDMNRIKGALYGVAVGDALGATTEFMTEDQIKKKYGVLKDMVGGGWLNLQPGEITDDTQMTIAVADGIIKAISKKENITTCVGNEFIKWYESKPKDVGSTCANAISAAMAKQREIKRPLTNTEWKEVSKNVDQYMHGQTAGNGSLMRMIFIPCFFGLYFGLPAINISSMTHYSQTATKACLVYGECVQRALWTTSKEDVFDFDMYEYDDFQYHSASGYSVDSLHNAITAFAEEASFEDVIVKLVNMGGDADTIAAIAGGLAGAFWGYDAIPERWLEALDKKVKNKLDYFVEYIMEESIYWNRTDDLLFYEMHENRIL